MRTAAHGNSEYHERRDRIELPPQDMHGARALESFGIEFWNLAFDYLDVISELEGWISLGSIGVGFVLSMDLIPTEFFLLSSSRFSLMC